jgi:imidazolonepropionase-like amidohydrolase
MTECGFTPSQALESATRVAADACGLADTIGTLADGKVADVLVVRGDPLNDITQLADAARIAWVITGGSVVKRPGDQETPSS